MAFKIPAKRRRRSLSTTPMVASSSRIRSSSLLRSSPIRNENENTQKRVSLIPRHYRDDSTARSSRATSVVPSEINTVPQQADEQEEDESIDEIVMAIDTRDRGTIGCCYYVAANEALYLMGDVKSAGLEIIDLREHADPPARYMQLTPYPQ